MFDPLCRLERFGLRRALGRDRRQCRPDLDKIANLVGGECDKADQHGGRQGMPTIAHLRAPDAIAGAAGRLGAIVNWTPLSASKRLMSVSFVCADAAAII